MKSYGAITQNPMKKTLLITLPILLLAVFVTFSFNNVNAQKATEQPVVQAVMLWMEGCPHCHDVLENVLPPLDEQYGGQLQITLAEVSSLENINRLYDIAEHYGIPKEQVGVPFLIIGDQVLLGSSQIRSKLPELIERHLNQGGVSLPDYPEIAPFLSEQSENEESCPPTTPLECNEPYVIQEPLPSPTSEERSPPDPVPTRPEGYWIAIGTMVIMIAALLYSLIRIAFTTFLDQPPGPMPAWQKWAVPLLALVGLGVAGYLAYVETQLVEAVCGPVGDCNAVQSSPYARLFGVLPVGVLGMGGYLAILAAWVWEYTRQDVWAKKAPLAIFGMSLFGVLLSLYLTYLEPFVIEAVCMWCTSSAIILALLLLFSLNPFLEALTQNEE
ncbi:MAG: vitamin K epoxide reductase family protein [Anaerolineales bacterium]